MSRNLNHYERQIACSKRTTYQLTKLWNKDLEKASKLFEIIKNLRRYDKVKLHKGCVYTSRQLEGEQEYL